VFQRNRYVPGCSIFAFVVFNPEQHASGKKVPKKLSKKQERQLEQAIAKRKKHWALLARRDVCKVLSVHCVLLFIFPLNEEITSSFSERKFSSTLHDPFTPRAGNPSWLKRRFSRLIANNF
jgi:hypothetical protein